MTLRDDAQPAAPAEVAGPSGEGMLGRLIAAVLQEHSSLRAGAAQALNDAMAALGPGLTPRDARGLLTVLDERELAGVVDAQGRSVRALAVEALLRAGYPWALQIDPEVLAWYRAQSGARAPARRRWRAVAMAAAVAVAALALAGGTKFLLFDEPRPLFGLSANALAGDPAEHEAVPEPLQTPNELGERYSGPWGTLWAELSPRAKGPPALTWHAQGSPALTTGVSLHFVEVYRRDGARLAVWPITALQRTNRPVGADAHDRFPYLLPASPVFLTREPLLVVVRGRWDGKAFAVRTPVLLPGPEAPPP